MRLNAPTTINSASLCFWLGTWSIDVLTCHPHTLSSTYMCTRPVHVHTRAVPVPTRAHPPLTRLPYSSTTPAPLTPQAFGAARDAHKEQVLAMEAMQRHCNERRASRASEQRAGEARADPWQSRVGVAPLPPLMRDGSTPQRDASVDRHPDAIDATYRAALTSHTSWSSGESERRALDLTILTTFVAKDEEFVAAWLDDLLHKCAGGLERD